ncbi:MAG: amino acid-binding protein [Lachnospiraceae bacterium]|uniref:amino acid-binding protein n=1 Tax=Parablautia sp. Marseille-Q6255 TaxID=3039593 RepID=UPI0024BC28D5|nr:amino acid-binding protein [Parablautia sp. Marseille-Q6255]
MLSQISIYTENKKGAMREITELMQQQDINILGSVNNDSAEYGIVRMVVSQPQKALQSLSEKGYMCKLTDVLGIEIQDRVGELNRLLTALDESNINVNYMYLSFNRESGSPVMVFHTNDITEVEECLTAKGFCGLGSLREA